MSGGVGGGQPGSPAAPYPDSGDWTRWNVLHAGERPTWSHRAGSGAFRFRGHAPAQQQIRRPAHARDGARRLLGGVGHPHDCEATRGSVGRGDRAVRGDSRGLHRSRWIDGHAVGRDGAVRRVGGFVGVRSMLRGELPTSASSKRDRSHDESRALTRDSFVVLGIAACSRRPRTCTTSCTARSRTTGAEAAEVAGVLSSDSAFRAHAAGRRLRNGRARTTSQPGLRLPRSRPRHRARLRRAGAGQSAERALLAGRHGVVPSSRIASTPSCASSARSVIC